MLGDAHLSDAEVAVWADQIRRERKATAPWHYVNIPIDADGYDAKRDGNDVRRTGGNDSWLRTQTLCSGSVLSVPSGSATGSVN